MANSLWSKVRVAVLGKMHALLDEVANTPEAYKQRIRDLEAALADLRAAGDEAVGTATGHKRQIEELEFAKAQTQADIDLLIGDDDPSNDTAALELQVKVEEIDTQIATQQQLLGEAESNNAQLRTAIEQLEAKHREMVNNLQMLTLHTAATSAKNRAADAAEAALSASAAAGSASIDSIKREIERDKDVADARFARVIGGLQSDKTPAEVAKLARAQAALDARRAEIASKAAEGASASTA